MKKKGFTLIELLAVIVILAIIALIAVPVVLNIIEKARSGAAKSSAYSYIKAVETYAVTSELDNSDNKLEKNAKYNVTTSTTIDDKTYEPLNNLVEIKGSKPTGSDDYILLDDKKNVKDGKLTIDNYVVTIKNGNIESVTKGKTIEVESITVDENNINIGINETYKITATVLPENATDKSITYKSENSSILELDSTGTITGKSAGTTKITLTTSNGKTAVLSVTVEEETQVLADVVSVGDYVAYDAGTWTETKEKPTSQEQFGGYIAGQNKANSVECYYKPSLKGWRVLSVDASTKTVTLIHAGQPECYFYGTDSSSSVTNLNNRAASTYLNSNYARSAHMLNYDEAVAITGSTSSTSNDLRKTGTTYWLATFLEDRFLNDVLSDGKISGTNNLTLGVRPVVVLKANILTTGKGTDAVGQEAWTLVKP